MDQETKKCQNCKAPFVIELEDFDFYKKIDVPAPTWCPDCRRQRRLAFRNERTLYRRKCNAPGHTEDIISTFSPDKPVTVYDEKYWWSDAWDPLSYGRPYDLTKPFFTQYAELLRRVPLIALSVTNMANCSFCNVSEGDKGSLYISASEKNENVFYANRVVSNKDSADLYVANQCELCYELVGCHKCYRTLFSRNCTDCTESAFLYNCTGCDHCFGCANLRNKSYYIWNVPYSKGEYEERIAAFDLGTASGVARARAEHEKLLSRSIRRFAHIIKSVGVTGDNVGYSKNCKEAFDLVGNPSVEDSKFINWGGAGAKDLYDCGPGIGVTLETAYEVTDTGIQVARAFFTSVVYGSYDIWYSVNCHGSHNLFGCYGLRSKEHCILNVQYTKEEYEALVPKIRQQMMDMPYTDAKGRTYRYGEFFPFEVSPYAYNEVIAQEYFPLTKEQAQGAGYTWKESETKGYVPTIQPDELPDGITDVPETVTNEIIACSHRGACVGQCATAFRILPQELAFYRKMKLPLPRLCPNCRHEERLKLRNPLKLWHRTCQCGGATSTNGAYTNTATHEHGTGKCEGEFETTYAPEKSEIVYCETCYQAEVM
jgi:Zn ribbon nucleic-acid-binding protein